MFWAIFFGALMGGAIAALAGAAVEYYLSSNWKEEAKKIREDVTNAVREVLKEEIKKSEDLHAGWKEEANKAVRELSEKVIKRVDEHHNLRMEALQDMNRARPRQPQRQGQGQGQPAPAAP